MSFLFPSMLWGLFASLIPLIIHLFNQNTTKTVEFSSIQHIKVLESDSIRSLKLKQWILVLIRTFIIVCLILMCSGPIQRNNSEWVPSTKESVAVIVIDNSASLGVEKNGETYLEKNISLLPRIFSAFEGVTNLKIYQTNPPKMIFNDFIEEGIEVDYENLKIQQSKGKDNLWFFVDSILQFVNDNTPNKELYILSDIPSNPPSNFMNNHDEWQFYFTENDKALNNLSINTVSTVNQMKLPNHLLKLNTRIENSGNTQRKNVPIELYLNEERIGQIVSSFMMNRTKDFLFQAYPGKSGIIKGRIEISKDDFAFDNTKLTGFDNYIVKILDLVPASNSVNFHMYGSTDNGNSFVTGAWSAAGYYFAMNTTGSGQWQGGNNQNYINIGLTSGTAGSYGACMQYEFFDLNSSEPMKWIHGTLTSYHNNGNQYGSWWGGRFGQAGNLNYLKWQFYQFPVS